MARLERIPDRGARETGVHRGAIVLRTIDTAHAYIARGMRARGRQRRGVEEVAASRSSRRLMGHRGHLRTRRVGGVDEGMWSPQAVGISRGRMEGERGSHLQRVRTEDGRRGRGEEGRQGRGVEEREEGGGEIEGQRGKKGGGGGGGGWGWAGGVGVVESGLPAAFRRVAMPRIRRVMATDPSVTRPVLAQTSAPSVSQAIDPSIEPDRSVDGRRSRV